MNKANNNKVNNERKDKMMVFIKAVIKSLTWTLLTSFLGLLQLWITIGISYMVKDIDFTLQTAIINGSFLFFIMAIIAATTVDYFFAPSLRIPKWTQIFVFNLYPFFIALFVGVSYSLLYTFDTERLNTERIENSQYIAIFLTFIYALFSKFVMFYSEDIIIKKQLIRKGAKKND